MSFEYHVIRDADKGLMPILIVDEEYLFSYEGSVVASLDVPYEDITNCNEKFITTDDLLIDMITRKRTEIGSYAKLSASREIVAVLDNGGLKIFDYDDITKDPVEYDDVDIDSIICAYNDEVIVKKMDDGFYRYSKQGVIKENKWACDYVSVCDGYLLCNTGDYTFGSNDGINFTIVYEDNAKMTPWMNRFDIPAKYDDFVFQSDNAIYFLDNRTLVFAEAGRESYQLTFSNVSFADI